jgi:hypothetical protein
MTRPNKLEGLPLNDLSGQVFEFEGNARANPIGAPFRWFLLGKLLVLPANVRLDWKVIARYKHSSLFGLIISNEGKKFYNIDTSRMMAFHQLKFGMESKVFLLYCLK